MAVIVQITDLHLRPQGATCLGHVPTNTLAARACTAVRNFRPRPDLVVVTGDVSDLGEPASYDLAAGLFSKLDAPVLAVPGNHDLRAEFRAAFAGRFGMPDGRGGDRIVHVHEGTDFAVIALDTLVEGAAHGELGRDQLAVLDEALARLSGKPVLIGLHHPPFATGVAHMDRIGLVDRAAFAEVLGRHPQVGLVVAGHVHRMISGTVAGVRALTLPGTAHQVMLSLGEAEDPGFDGAQFVMEPPAFGVHILTEEGRFASHLEYVEAFPGPYPFRRAAGVEWSGYPAD